MGKSTIFNALTGLNQHTGNWSGKTVDSASGAYSFDGDIYRIYDLPGTYSLNSDSPEEEISRQVITTHNSNLTVVIADATCLVKGINLLLSILMINKNVVLCINLADEAKRNGINIDIDLLQKYLKIPIISISAKKKKDIQTFKKFIAHNVNGNFEHRSFFDGESTIKEATEICNFCVTQKYSTTIYKTPDKILTSKRYGIPIMLCFLCAILWLTVSGANYPSQLLFKMFSYIRICLENLIDKIYINDTIKSILIDGIYHTTTWVIAVMLPPMLIFFPVFTLLEDIGFLPRIAFNLDKCFKCAGTCGKQALTMCMGLGCNAVGVTGCRIISSEKERIAAMITNCFMPCNGRFSMLITLSAIFIGGAFTGVANSFFAALFVLFLILLGTLITFAVTKIITKLLKYNNTNFILELPSYRRPQILKTIFRSIYDRTLVILKRAVLISIPAGVVIWIMANVYIGQSSVFNICADFIDPFARLLGLDGVIILAFILALPANEIVLPIIIMGYMATVQMTDNISLTELHTLFIANNWTIVTAINVMLFSLLHFPCATTLLTIKSESKSLFWTFMAFVIPTVVAAITCMSVKAISIIIENLYFLFK